MRENKCYILLLISEYFIYTDSAIHHKFLKCKKAMNTITQPLENCFNKTCTVCEHEASAKDISTPPRYPFLSQIGYLRNEEYDWQCVGIIISPIFILTVTECIHKYKE